MRELLDRFTGIYSLSKTLRFELKPVGRTLDNIQKGKFLESDKKKSSDYQNVKKIIDNYHKYFIDDVLKDVQLDWTTLAEEISKYNKSKIDDTLAVEQKKLREILLSAFIKDKRFKVLSAATPKDLFSSILPEWFRKNAMPELNKKALETFQRFTSYFVGFQENRKNMYTAEPIPTAVPFRLVNDNFPKFLQNISTYDIILRQCPEVISQVEKELAYYLDKDKLSDIFTIQSFNRFLCQGGAEKQRGIDYYNQIIGGIVKNEGTQSKRGINQFLNLYWQQHPEFAKQNRRIKMIPLFKQILSDRSSLSFKLETIESDEDLKTVLTEYADRLESKAEDDGKSVFDTCCELFDSIASQNLNEIFINRKDINAVSMILTGSWSWLQSRMNTYAEEIFKTKAERARWQKSLDYEEGENKSTGMYSLEELNSVLEYSSVNVQSTGIRITDYFNHRKRYYADTATGQYVEGDEDIAPSIKEACEIILARRKEMDSVLKNITAKNILRDNAGDVEKIKDYLDAVQELLHRIKPLRGNSVGDPAFYAVFDSVYIALNDVVSIYNKTRNYITKRTVNTGKYKLNFDNPSLADGWDLNKEQSNTSVLFRKDGLYYLGIMNPKNKPKFLEQYDCQGKPYYEKMVYKLLPGPNKMLPKVFFSAKGKSLFNPPESILKGYEQGKHKKGDSFDRKFCHELIDWFKDAINRHEDWKKFNFNFSDTKSYSDISDFYREVTEQGYKLNFISIPEKEIADMVADGRLYLFQIYNKDFAPGATGMPNMHTLYWRNLFSAENLSDVTLKLNGEAELFYRPAAIENPVVHKAGTYLVNRTTEDGEPIPDKIHEEIYKNANGTLGSLSTEAKDYMSTHKVIIKKASHDIIKDRHYTDAKFLFHVPITLNFKASGNAYSMNENVRRFLRNNPDVNIIGLDRGERHLIYLSLINQKGEIIRQFTFNEVERQKNGKTVMVDYHEKLDQREKERDAARKSWQTIGKIAELKEGYLSAVIHQLTKLMVEYNAIIVMEDLNFGFKRGRFHVEKQVYQKLEQMLIDKLNYLVFKDRGLKMPGGVLNGYQLAGQFESFQKLGKQSGMIFYVPAGYTSKIDPKTGFVDMMSFKDLTNVHKKRDFFSRFEDVHYDGNTDSFVFKFDYKSFEGKAKEEMKQTRWSVYSRGKRIAFSPKTKKSIDIYPTEDLKKVFDNMKILYKDGNNLIDSIMCVGSDLKSGERPARDVAEFWDKLIYLFKLVLQMRNSSKNEDYIISPVKSADGSFYDSREEFMKGKDARLPVDADANGAYHIALKGLNLLRRLNLASEEDLKKTDIKITNADWFAFTQEKQYAK